MRAHVCNSNTLSWMLNAAWLSIPVIPRQPRQSVGYGAVRSGLASELFVAVLLHMLKVIQSTFDTRKN